MKEWCAIKENLEQRAEELALYLIENQTTVRAAAKQFGISKSTVHKDISERLPLYNRALWLQVKALLEENGQIMHGGSIVDATIIEAPSSTKNAENRRDPEMHQVKKATNGILASGYISAQTRERATYILWR